MKLKKRVFVVGGDLTPFIGKHHPDFVWKKHPDFGKRENPTLEKHMAAAIRGALEKTGVTADAIERGFVGNFAGELFSQQGHLGAMVARADEALAGKPFARLEGACASGALAVVSAIDALHVGNDVVMAVGAEVQTSVSARDGAGYLARAAHWESEREIDDFTFPAMFARRAKHYKEAYGVSDADIAHVVAKAYRAGNQNPKAHMRCVQVDYEHASKASDTNPNFLRNEELKPHLKVTDCSQVSDGAAALILATEEGLKKIGKKPEDCVEILSYGQATNPLGAVEDYTFLDTTHRAASEAYSDSGLTPDEIEVAEVHDCFAIAEVMMYEALGFAERGQGTQFAAQGGSGPEGKTPVNTGGGLLAFGHPVGATGIKQVLEIYRQMKGLSSDYQLKTEPQVGLTANMGGDDRTAVVMTYRNVS